ncbi:TPA: hypothetical protein ACN70R_004920, partial [Klebsiella pneumoniae]|nr:hypothetical protein [Klebsiella pneumoniae]
FCEQSAAFPSTLATIFFYQKARSIEPIHRKEEMAQKMVCCCFHTIVQERYSDESKSVVRGTEKGNVWLSQ